MNIIIIMSGGVGNRFGANIPKQYCQLNGRPVIDYVIDAAKGSKVADKVVVVARVAALPSRENSTLPRLLSSRSSSSAVQEENIAVATRPPMKKTLVL